MLQFCDRVLAYTQGIERTAFTLDAMRYDATLRNLELMGEQRPTYRKNCARTPPLFHGARSSPRAIG